MIRVVSGLIIAAMTASGCQSLSKLELADYERPIEKRQTYLTDTMGCFGELVNLYRRPSPDVDEKLVRLAIPEVLDHTGYSRIQDNSLEIPPDMTAIALTEASRMGGVFRIAHVPTQREFQNFFPAQISAQYPAAFSTGYYAPGTLMLYGALTEYDRLLTNDRSNATAGGSFGGGSGETDLRAQFDYVGNLGRLTMDFRLVSVTSGEVINLVSSSNTARIEQRSKTAGVSVSIDGNTASVLSTNSVVDARHAAIRVLIQHGLVETLGKRLRVPYWKCFNGDIDKRDIENVDFLLREKWNFEQVLSGEGRRRVMRQASRDSYDNTLIVKAIVRNSDGKVVDYSEQIAKSADTDQCERFLGGRDPDKFSCSITGSRIKSQHSLMVELAGLYNDVTSRFSDDPERLIATEVPADAAGVAYLLRSLQSVLSSTMAPNIDFEVLSLEEIYARLWMSLVDLEAHYAAL